MEVKNESQFEKPNEQLPVGQIIPGRSTKIDASVSYAIYLPVEYATTKKWPLLLLFDAQARGTLPLELYKEEANRLGFILLCSNDSRNGNTTELTNKIISGLLSEAITQYAIDTNCIFTGGFSGGARIASLCAFQNPIVKGVIGVSAGFPGNQKPDHSFRFIGITGKEDFNYKELNQLDAQLSQSRFPHCLLIHNGKHDWCPPDLIGNAMVLFLLDAMRNKAILFNQKILDENKISTLKKIDQLKSENHYADAKMMVDFMLECEKDLVDSREVKQQLAQLLQSNVYQKEETELKAQLVEENVQVQNYVKSIGRPLGWWNDEVNKIRKQIDSASGTDRSYMLKRVLGGISIQCYGYTQQVINANEIVEANYIVALYKLVDPENKDPWFFSAVLNARNGNNEKAIEDLSTSITNGFIDKNRLLNEPAFQSLQSQPAFSALLAKIPSR